MVNNSSEKTQSARQRRRRMSKRERFLRRYGLWIGLVLVLVVVGVVLVCRSCSRDSSAAVFNGTYEIDGYTAYEFDGKGGGAMCLGETTRYAFDYSVKADTVSFDFEEEIINDTTYKFILNGDTITITDISGTNSYTMTKKLQ